MAEMKMEQTLTSQGKVRLLSNIVRQTAHESAESLWSDVLDTVDMDTARCFEQAVTALMGCGSYDKAMGMITGHTGDGKCGFSEAEGLPVSCF